MGKEIERKYLVVNDSYRQAAVASHTIAQGYLSTDPDRTVRVRILDTRGFLTVKTRNRGAARMEWEFEIPAHDAREMLSACLRTVEKTRYIVPAENGLRWEVDEFRGRLDGLVLAEIELPAEDCPVVPASFIGQEVTGDPRYYNSNL